MQVRDQFRKTFTNLGSFAPSSSGDQQSHSNARKCKILIAKILDDVIHQRTQSAEDSINENVISEQNPDGVLTSAQELYLNFLKANDARQLEALLRKDEAQWDDIEEITLLRSARSRHYS